jgi:hypothetical protein
MNLAIFMPLLEQMDRDGSDFIAPRPFASYIEEIGIRRKRDGNRTAACISIDFQENLRPELRESKVMVFRCGIPLKQRNTHFGLARTKGSWNDYFLIDNINFDRSEFHLNQKQREQLSAFQVLPTLTEKSLVNFVLASGLIQDVLELDNPEEMLIPANCQSTFSFQFQPHNQIDAVWDHTNGQVEIDSLFFARKGGERRLFLIESKHNIAQKTLAKHKLVYPILSMRSELSNLGIPIMPIYMKTQTVGSDLLVDITMCDFPHTSKSVSELRPNTYKHVYVKDFLESNIHSSKEHS